MLRYALNNAALEKEYPLYKFASFISKMLWFNTLDQNRYVGYKKQNDDYWIGYNKMDKKAKEMV